MAKSLLYVPGLARLELVVKPAKTGREFDTKIGTAFHGDGYMVNMVETIKNKGAIPRDCCQLLRWICIPTAVPGERVRGTAKAFEVLERGRKPNDPGARAMKGSVASAFALAEARYQERKDAPWNVLSLEPGVPAKPMKMGLGWARKPCTAPQYMAQPLPPYPHPGKEDQALADVAKGDTLYIVGHSNALGCSLTYKSPALNHVTKPPAATGCEATAHAEQWHIDPVTLASLMINEGLPARVVFDVALVACYSGGLDDPQLQTVQCFAQRLAGTLSARGYRCRVYGATRLTTSDKTNVQVCKRAEKQPDGKILLDTKNKEQLDDAPGQPFYRRFFRFYP
jgi:hypothetical protein